MGLFLDGREHDGGVGAGDAGDGAQHLDEQAVERAGVAGLHLEEVRVLPGDAVALEHLVEALHLLGEAVEELGVLDAHADERGDVDPRAPRRRPAPRSPVMTPRSSSLRIRSATAGCESPTACASSLCVVRALRWSRSTMRRSAWSMGL